jgi:hypothetical protein
MSEQPTPVVFDDDRAKTSDGGEAIADGKGRIFPCDECGADLVFSIGQQSLECPYCKAVKKIEIPPDEEIVEQDLEAMLARIQELKQAGKVDKSNTGEHEVRCEGCGANVVFLGTLTSSTCPYCGTPLQRDKVHDAPQRIPVNGVLPFAIPQEKAAANLRAWVKSLWFAPNAFKRQGAEGKFSGVYLPYFTFDALTFTRFVGQRGDHYYVTVGTGKDARQERRTRWSTVGGEFRSEFDDIPVLAANGQQPTLIRALEPWPFQLCKPFRAEMLAGFFSRTYDIELAACFGEARGRMEAAITAEVRQRIGGDEQTISSQKTAYSALAYKHLLLPVWLLVYRYQNKPYRIAVNAATGEVQGERPYSWVKIMFAVLSALAVVLTIVALANR